MNRPAAAALDSLLQAEQGRFFSFLAPRLGSREAARDFLQAAILKAVERQGALRNDKSVRAWFFRLLRNGLVDHYRNAAAERRALERHAQEASEAEALVGLEDQVCGCVRALALGLQSEPGNAVHAVDVEGQTLAAYAEASQVRPATARVRLHRARRALSRQLIEMCGTCCQQGCAGCSCDD